MMNDTDLTKIINLYRQGYSLRKIAQQPPTSYGRELIRREIKKAGLVLRGRGTVYQDYDLLSDDKKAMLAELLGYLYGDGSLYQYKNSGEWRYECVLTLSHNEHDLVQRVGSIVEQLFWFRPYIQKRESVYIIKLRPTLARYIAQLGYPAGKKSILNPPLPVRLLQSDQYKKHFIRGFFNAEATVNKTVTVQQSVRLEVDHQVREKLKNAARKYAVGRNRTHYYIKWKSAKEMIDPKVIPPSKILGGIQSLLANLGIPSTISPIRICLSNSTGIHYELRIPVHALTQIKDLKILTCNKKVQKLNLLLQE